MTFDVWPDWRSRDVVYRDEHLLVVDKPAGVPSQAAEPEHDDDVVARLKRYLAVERGVAPEEVYLGIHQRLDRGTSGLMCFALAREMNAGLARQFEGRTVGKGYVAAVQGRLPGGGGAPRTLRDLLAKGKGGVMRVVPPGTRGAREAVTEARELERRGPRALLALQLRTGRTHQLRVQLANAGAPIAGDGMYGGAQALRLMLHASELSLRHPRGGSPLTLRVPPPAEIEAFVEHGFQDPLTDAARLSRALELALESRYRLGRMRHLAEPTTAFRLFHRAGDGCEAFAVDLYGEHLVLHLFEALPEERTAALLAALDALGPAGIYLKHHPKQKNELGASRQAELAPPEPVRGRPAPDELVVHEQGVPLGVRLGDGFSTGIFLDQRDNRRRVRERARGKRVLNLFAYTGGFSVAALAGGATEATCVDTSRRALDQARRNVARIDAADRHHVVVDDVFAALARMARRGQRFDLIVADPPSYSTTRGGRFRVLKDYRRLVAACAPVLAEGGELLACINHHGSTRGRLRQEVRAGLEGAGRKIARLRDLPAALDFPAPAGAEPDAKSLLAELA